MVKTSSGLGKGDTFVVWKLDRLGEAWAHA